MPIKKQPSCALFAVTLVALGLAASAAAQDAATIAKKGNGQGAPPCASCHGADGAGQAASGFPRLAGLDPAYFEEQLASFANGSRENAVMQPIAKALSKDEGEALANYYAKMPVPAAASTSAKPKDNTLGKQLALRGRWSKQVPACVACHGPHGVGVGAHFPPLAGQPASYLINQLSAFKKGTRHNGPLGLMKHVAENLSGKDMQAVAHWFAAQPTSIHSTSPGKGGTP
jgi:cytochrome c553